MNVGAQGRNPITGFNRQNFRIWLGRQIAEDEEREAAAKRSADESRFEQDLRLSGLSEADKQRARMARHNPAIARVMEDVKDTEERERIRKANIEAQEQARQDTIKARADAAAENQRAKNEAMRMAAEGFAGGVRTEILPHQFAQGLRGAKPSTEQARLPIPSFGGMGGGSVTVPGMDEVQVQPAMPPSDMVKWMQANDPDNPALQALKEQEFQQRRTQMVTQIQKGRAKQVADEEKKKIEAEKETIRQQQIVAAKAWLGAKATPEEIQRFFVMSMAPKADPGKIAAAIIKDRGASAKASETKQDKVSKKEETITDKIDSLKLKLLKAQAKANDELLDDGKRKAAQAEADAISAEIRKFNERKDSLHGKQSTAQKAVQSGVSDEAEHLKSKLEAAKKSGDPAKIKDAENEMRAYDKIMGGGGPSGAGQAGGGAGDVPRTEPHEEYQGDNMKGFRSGASGPVGASGEVGNAGITSMRAENETIAPNYGLQMDLSRLRQRGESVEDFLSRKAAVNRMVSAGRMVAQTPEARDAAILNKKATVILQLINEENQRGNEAHDRGDRKAWEESKRKVKELMDHYDKVTGG